MSRLGCKCGHIMGSTESPSPYSIYVYYESEITQAISDNNNLTVMDFLSNWDEKHSCKKQYMKRKEEVDYWYCLECKRVYECQVKIGGHWLRVYQRKEAEITESFDKKLCTKLYVFTEIHSDNVTEIKPNILLSEFIDNLSKAYYTSIDENTIYVVSKDSNELLYIYELEEVYTSDISQKSSWV